MKTILELIHTIKELSAELEIEVQKLNEPFSGMLDTEHQEQVEQERNVDHYQNEQI